MKTLNQKRESDMKPSVHPSAGLKKAKLCWLVIVMIALVHFNSEAGKIYRWYPHWAEGVISGLGDGQVIADLGIDFQIHFYVQNDSLRNVVWVKSADGVPYRRDDVKYDLTAEGQTIRGLIIVSEDTLDLEFEVTGGSQVTGEYSGVKQGNISGRFYAWTELTEEAEPLGGPQWPQWCGPEYNWRAMDDHELISDISDAVPLWRSEEWTPSGIGSISRMGSGADKNPIGGGSASPIVAEGNVYLNYFVPSGSVYDTALVTKCAEPYRDNPRRYNHQKQRLLIDADDIILAIDGKTGRTKWKKTFAGKGANWQNHKGGPNNNTMVYGDGKVYAVGSTCRIYCLNATTGDLVWEGALESKHDFLEGKKAKSLAEMKSSGPFFATGRDLKCAPLYASGLFIMYDYSGSLVALDGENGDLVWQYDGVAENVPGVWTRNADTSLLTYSSDKKEMICLDLGTGSEKWKQPAGDWIEYRTHGPNILGDYMSLYVGHNQSNKTSPELWMVGARLTDDGFDRLWKILIGRSTHCGPPAITETHVLGGSDYHTNTMYSGEYVKNSLLVVEKETGSVVNQLDGWMTGTNSVPELLNDKVLCAGDDHHAKGELWMVKTSGSEVSVSGPKTRLPHSPTSPYHDAPFARAYADGRLFIRGLDGVYAYDLRSSASDVNSIGGFAEKYPFMAAPSRIGGLRSFQNELQIRITTVRSEKLSVSVYDTRGRLLRFRTFEATKSELGWYPLGGSLRKGFYIVRLASGTTAQTEKLMLK